VTPNVALTAWDSDVIKEYVRAGFGVGILADIAIKDEDSDLRVIDASHLFPPHTTWVGFQRGALLRSYMYEFMQLLGAHLPKRQIQAIEQAGTQDAVDKAMAGVDIPFLRP
jgi:LysR family cys regulon transcriptional activator